MPSSYARLRHHARQLIGCAPFRLTVYLLISIVAGLPMLDQAVGLNTYHDAHFLSAYERHARLSLLAFHQLPLWDPYSCGGMYTLAAPQTRHASPFFLLSLLFDVDPAISLIAVLLSAIGMEGMYLYARRWGASRLAAFAFAPLFPLSGFFADAFRLGWTHFYSFCLLPWILWSLRGALRGDRRAALICATTAAVTVGFGGTYTLPMALLPALGELIDATVPGRRHIGEVTSWRRHLRKVALGCAVTLSLTVGIAAYRLWPMAESAAATLRVMAGEERFSVQHLLRMFFAAASPGHTNQGQFYIAPVVILALLASPFRRWRPLWLVAALSFILALGQFAPFAPFALVRKLPVYGALRHPERYLLLCALVLSLLAARGMTLGVAWARLKGGVRGAQLASLACLAAALVGVILEAQNGRAHGSNVQLEPSPVFTQTGFRQSRGNRWLMSHFAPAGMGSLACGEAYPLPMSRRLRGDLPAEEYLVALGDETVRPRSAQRIRFTPNALEVRVDAARPVRLAVNQNYHPGWRANIGRVESWDGLLSVVLPQGQHDVVLAFRPRSGIGGLLVSLVALLGGLLFTLRRPMPPFGRLLCVTIGPILIGALLLLWPEPRWERPAPRDEAGAPVVLDRFPDDAQVIGATFDTPLILEGARIPKALAAQSTEVPIEFLFRRTGDLPVTLGIFVRAIGPGGRTVYGDHPSLSGQVYLSRMPQGAVVRDAFRLALPPGVPGLWEVRVGLWNAYGDGARRVVLSPGHARVEDNTVIVGTFNVTP